MASLLPVTDEAVDAAADVLGRALGPQVRVGAPLAPLTTYRAGGTAAILVQVEREADLAPVAAAMAISGMALLVIGQGSNLLVSDEGVRAITLVLGGAFAAIDVDSELVTAGAAVKLPVLARRSAAVGRTGLEWAVGVPGSVGGAVRMNAGGHGSDIAASLARARVATLGDQVVVRDMTPGDLELRYRGSALDARQVVLAAAFRCPAGDVGASEAVITDIVRWRREHQPGGQNCGSVFTNPPGMSAGRLIDECGLKGYRIGTACVSVKHANFIQLDEGGQTADVWTLIGAVRERVHAGAGVWLHPEVRTAGPFAELPGDAGDTGNPR